ncbi:Digestive organ expansion factor, predicted [Ostreococcus tauri]|uniref:Digestive organ expansion factor, predicted n=1 Tax=Ostreococcus tauri TaxID=70448 RepID=A0A096P8T3_OSTTA|nr:Digestive organ expansion factor, predicted [Ostreococcus tauri]CEG00295.1 Digestive organ expansion factor, predicted [Ostreococcus tauri]|eukprot:XP_022840300.1 Digestive organ expansion factor, predicted [Ostreococcus tauri]
MPASAARKRSRRTVDRARPNDRVAKARAHAPTRGEDASDSSDDEREGAAAAVAGTSAYDALLASLGTRGVDAHASDESESERESESEEDGSEEDGSEDADASDDGADGADDAEVDATESDDERSVEEEGEDEENDDGGTDEDAGESGDENQDASAMERHARLGEALRARDAEELKTRKIVWRGESGAGASTSGSRDDVWEGACGLEVPKAMEKPNFVNAKTAERWKEATGKAGFASASQAALYSVLASYVDVQHGNRKLVPDQGPAGQQMNDETLDAVCLHVIDHVTRTRNRVMKNNEGLAKKAKAGIKVVEDDLPRDQGFVRPTVLFLTPMRNIAGRAIMRLLDLCPAAHGRNDAVNKLERIEEDFLAYEASDDENDEVAGKKRKFKPFVPEDHTALFKGNTDDHFRLGLKLTKASVRLYVDFFGADIIFASPLGIVTALQDEKTAGDFLSSIEILVIDHAHVIQMQNWAHVVTILDAMNQLPKDMRDCDVQRVRESHLNGFARNVRQTILLSAFQTPEINSLFNRRCVNFAGKVRLRTTYKGVLGQLTLKTRQQFERIPMKSSDVVNADDIRFKYFVKNVLPRVRENPEPGVVIFVSSYFDFVRVRNLLTKEDVSFAVNSEYTEPREAARARTLFADGRKRVLLLSERAHFYFRRRIKGAREICFYSLPEHAHFYPELVSYLAGSSAAVSSASNPAVGHAAGVVALFSKLDALKLERVVGAARRAKMIGSKERPMFLFI